MDLVDTCAQERENTKLRFALTTNITIFCALLENISMGYIDAVLPEQLLRQSDVNCLLSNGYGETYKDYLCLFRAIPIHLYGSPELETNAKVCLVHSSRNLDRTQSTSEGYRSIILHLFKMR